MSADTDRARDALSHIDSGRPRADWVCAGMAAKSAGLSFDDFHRWSEPAHNYKSKADCTANWKSFDDSGKVTVATLFAMATAQGWKNPGKTRHNGHDGRRASAGAGSTRQAEAAPRRAAKQATGNVADVWERCVPADPADAYICLKQGTADGLRLYPASAPPLVISGQNVAGYVAVPCWDGNICQTIQFIPPDGGDKLNLPGAVFGDGFFTVGTIDNKIYICEGLGQAWACWRVTGCASVVCFGSGRMATVAKVLRTKYPLARLVVVPDRGKEINAAAIADDIAGEWCELPQDRPDNYDANDLLRDAGADALADLLEHTKAPAMRFKLLTDAVLATLPPMKWRIKDVFPETGFAAVFGASGSGKSFLILDALQSLAAGNNWFDYRVKACSVIYCALEGEGGIAGRVRAYRIRHGACSECIRYLVQPFNLLDSADIPDLARAIAAAGGAGVVVLDTMNRAAPGADENDSKSMGQIIAGSKALQTLVGGLVILVHHTGKDASKGLRGHSSLLAALDSAIEVRRDGDRREWIIAKSKDGEDGASHPFKLNVVELGTDENGEPITSCTVQPLAEVAETIRRALPPKSGNQRAVWDALGELFRRAGNDRPEGAPDKLPQGRPCILLEVAIEQTRTRLVCEPKRQTERTQSAIRGLIDRGLLCHEGGFLWCQ